MQPEQIKQALKDWGHAVQNRYAVSRGDRTVHVLQQVREHAPGTRDRAERDLVGREGFDRRRYMAARSGVAGMTMLPTWAVDPVRASNDAGPPRELAEIAVDMGIPDHLRWVDRAVASLSRRYPMRAECLREEYCSVGSQTVKARRVEEKYGGKFSVWNYRRELARGLDWVQMHGEGHEPEEHAA